MPNTESRPKYGRILKTVRSDLPWSPLIVRKDQVFPLVFNRHGAAAALFPNGDTLGLKPDEYEPAEPPGSETTPPQQRFSSPIR